jgi:hypothetical protein
MVHVCALGGFREAECQAPKIVVGHQGSVGDCGITTQMDCTRNGRVIEIEI